MSLPIRARIQILHDAATGAITASVDGGPPEPHTPSRPCGAGPDILDVLGLPRQLRVLELLAAPRGWSRRCVRFIVSDESPVYDGGEPRHPQTWAYRRRGHDLTLSHVPLLIGQLEDVYAAVVPPAGSVGHCLLGSARLYDSLLADAVWVGLRTGAIRYVSATTVIEPMTGREELAEVALCAEPYCDGARILDVWEA